MLAASARRINAEIKATKYRLFKVHAAWPPCLGRIISDTLLNAPMLFASCAKCVIRSLSYWLTSSRTMALGKLPTLVQFELYGSDDAHWPATSHHGRHDGLKQKSSNVRLGKLKHLLHAETLKLNSGLSRRWLK
jgi:hypothetical protein